MVETISVREDSSSSFLATRESLIGSGQRTAHSFSLADLSLSLSFSLSFLASLASLAGGAAEVASRQPSAAKKPLRTNKPTSSERPCLGRQPRTDAPNIIRPPLASRLAG